MHKYLTAVGSLEFLQSILRSAKIGLAKNSSSVCAGSDAGIFQTVFCVHDVQR